MYSREFPAACPPDVCFRSVSMLSGARSGPVAARRVRLAPQDVHPPGVLLGGDLAGHVLPGPRMLRVLGGLPAVGGSRQRPTRLAPARPAAAPRDTGAATAAAGSPG